MATAWRASGSTTPVVSDCKSETTELGYTDGLYKMMQNESERYVSHEPAFYYHTDHLGSTSRFTDDSGKVVQTLAYMPYGEDWVDDSKFIYSDTNHIGIYQFNGKERDFESGFYYYGARYHWPELWTGWTSPDPLMDKYPGISPYNYCEWNPVIFIDPDGNFPVKIHKKMVQKALNGKNIGSNVKNGLLYGTGIHSDWFHSGNSTFHMDNMKGTESILKLYNDHMKSFSDNMDRENYIAAGADLHAIGDFYAHSNYIDLYQQYYESRGESVSVENIKPFSEMFENQDFMDYVEVQGGLKTGTFSIKDWFSEKFFNKTPEQGSHSLMNMDIDNSPHGMESFGTGNTKHQAARAAAQKEINKLIQGKLSQ